MAARYGVGLLFFACWIDGVKADGLPTGAVIGIVVASFIFLKFLILLIVTCKNRARRRRQQREAEQRIMRVRQEQISRNTLPVVSSQVRPPQGMTSHFVTGYANPACVGDFAPPPYSPTAPPGELTPVTPFYPGEYPPPPGDYPPPPNYEDIIVKDPDIGQSTNDDRTNSSVNSELGNGSTDD